MNNNINHTTLERSGNYTSRSMSRPYSYAGEDTTKDECFRIHRVPQRRSTLLIFERHANLRYKYGSRTFWCRGYFVDTTGKNDKAIAEYIKNQLEGDQLEDQMTLKEHVYPFTGSK